MFKIGSLIKVRNGPTIEILDFEINQDNSWDCLVSMRDVGTEYVYKQQIDTILALLRSHRLQKVTDGKTLQSSNR